MAQLTWRNVDAPDLTKASDILNRSALMMGDAMSGLGQTLQDVRDRQRRDRSAAVLPELARVANEGGVDAALAKMGSMIDPSDMTPELQQAMMNLRGNALDFESSRASTTSTMGTHNRNQENHRRTITREDQLAELTSDLVGNWERATNLYGGQGGTPAGNPGAGGPLNDREILARTIMAEAGGEGYEGMLGVGSVIANRARTGRYGKNIRDVIMAPGQFSAWNSVTGYAGGEGGLDMNRMRANENAYRAADAILSGNYEDITGGATHYYNDKVATPKWGIQAGGKWGRIGNHVFGVPAGEQGVYGAAPRQDLQSITSQLNRPGNLVRPEDIFPQLLNIQDASETSMDRANTQEQKANERADRQRAEQERLIQEQADGWALENMSRFPTNLTEVVTSIANDDTLSTAEKQARMAAVRKIYEENSDFYTLNEEGAGLPPGWAEASGAMQANMAFSNAVDPDLQTLAQIMDAPDNRAPVEIFTEMKKSLSDAEAEGLDSMGGGQFVNVVERIAKEYGVSSSMVAQIGTHHMKQGYFSKDIELNEDSLAAAIKNVLGDPETFSAVSQRQQSMEQMQGEATRLEAEVRRLIAERNNWNQPGRDPEERQTRVAKIDAALTSRMMQMEQLQERAANEARTIQAIRNSAKGRGGGDGGGGGETPPPANRAGGGPVDQAFQRVLGGQGDIGGVMAPQVLDESVETPEGNAVDTEASQAIQDLQRLRRGNEIGGNLVKISNSLRMTGPALPRAFAALENYFADPKTREANEQNRTVRREALEWFESKAAEEYFKRNPGAMSEAVEDPVNFWLRFKDRK